MLSGLASRSNATARVHRAFRDGYATESDFKSAIGDDEKEIVARQDGFAYLSAGQLDWLDILRPIARSFRGFASRRSAGEDSVGPVTRWFRTNTFYRKPLVNGRIDCEGGELSDVVPALGSNSVIFLPSPYSFSRLVEDRFYNDGRELAKDYAGAIAKSAPRLYEKGYRCVLLVDHTVGYERSRGCFDAPEWYAESISAVKHDGMVLGVSFPLAEAAAVLPLVEQSRADFVGVDAIFSNSVAVETKKDVMLGVVDGASTGIESIGTIGSTVREFLSGSDFPGRYYIGPNDRLYDVPFETALRKIEGLAAFKGAL
jgi:methionine synthase II (cobalamin-independent)